MSLTATPGPRVYVYKYLGSADKLSVRSTCEVTDSNKLSEQHSISKGLLVAVDQRRSATSPESQDGPCLHVADYHGGWIFEKIQGKQVLVEVPCTYALKAFKVIHKDGFTVCSRPCVGHRMTPPLEYALDTIFFTDVQVSALASGLVGDWVRVQGTNGWVLTKSEDKGPILQELDMEVAFSLVRGGEAVSTGAGVQSSTALDNLPVVRQWANTFGLSEV